MNCYLGGTFVFLLGVVAGGGAAVAAPAAESESSVGPLAEPAGASDQSGSSGAEAVTAAAPQPMPDDAASSVGDPPGVGAAAGDGVPPTIPVEPPAETTQQTAAPQKPSNRFIEEVIVTAQKREENVQDVPITVAAFSGEMLDARGIDSPAALVQLTPGLVYGHSYAFSVVYLRGVGTDSFLTADQSVASYIDDVYQPLNASASVQSFGRVERIEVLKGPQGTLFGRNSVGGAIRIQTERPSFTPQGGAELDYGRFDSRKVSAFYTGPMSDELAFSVAGQYAASDSYLEWSDGSAPDVAGKKFPNNESAFFRAKLLWQPADEFDLTLGAYATPKYENAEAMMVAQTKPSVLTQLLGGQAQPRGYTINADAAIRGFLPAPLNYVNRNDMYVATANWKPDGADLKALASHQKIETNLLYDFDGTGVPFATFSGGGPNHDQGAFGEFTTAELQLNSKPGGWGGDWLEWTVGYNYYDALQGLRPDFGLLGAYSVTQGLGGQSLLDLLTVVPPLLRTLRDIVPGPLQDLVSPVPLQGVVVGLDGVQSGTAHSVFGQATISFTDWASLTLGARFQREERKAEESALSLVGADGSRTQIVNFASDDPAEHLIFPPQGPLKTQKDTFSPKISVQLRPLDQVLLYGSWQRAQKSPVYNTINLLRGIILLPPEKIEAWEVGMKSDFFGGLARFNAAAWYYEQKDLQVQHISIISGGAINFYRAEAATSKGVEADMQFFLVPQLVEDLVFIAGAAYVDATFDKFTQAPLWAPETGLYGGEQDVSGSRVTRAPEWTANASLSKTTHFGWGSLEAAVDGYYTSEYQFNYGENPRYTQDAYYTIDARVSAQIEPWNLRLTLYVRNLTDEYYFATSAPTDFGDNSVIAPRLTYGFKLAYTF